MKFTSKEEVREAWDSLTMEQKESLENSSPVLEPKIDEPEESEQNIASDLILQSSAGLNR